MSNAASQGAIIKLHQSNLDQSLQERAAFILNGLVFIALLALIPLTAIYYGTVHTQWEVVFECSVFALAVLWVIEGTLSGTLFVRQHNSLVPLLAILIFRFIQTLPLLNASDSAPGVEGFKSAMSADT